MPMVNKVVATGRAMNGAEKFMTALYFVSPSWPPLTVIARAAPRHCERGEAISRPGRTGGAALESPAYGDCFAPLAMTGDGARDADGQQGGRDRTSDERSGKVHDGALFRFAVMAAPHGHRSRRPLSLRAQRSTLPPLAHRRGSVGVSRLWRLLRSARNDAGRRARCRWSTRWSRP